MIPLLLINVITSLVVDKAQTLAKEHVEEMIKQIIPKEDFQNIELSLKKEDYFELVRSLIVYHYDKAYKKTRAENHSNIFKIKWNRRLMRKN